MAAVALVNIGAFDLTARELLGALDDGCQGMAVVGVSRERLGMQHELAAGRASIGADDGCLNAELVGRTGLALADAFHLRSMERIQLPATLALVLRADL